MTVERFASELNKEVIGFVENIQYLKVGEHSFPDWYRMFGSWLELGTDMEEHCHMTLSEEKESEEPSSS